MPKTENIDYYETLQVGDNAELETIHRVYRMLAQRFHPDNRESGNENRFREITAAYGVLSDPEKRARYDATNEQRRKERWRLVSAGAESENDFEMEQIVRLTLLEALYTKRRLDSSNPAIGRTELERLLGRPREHLEFTIWYLAQKKYVTTDDQGRLYLTADGAEHLEESYRNKLHRKRLQAGDEQN